ncbi:MAG: AraC family transcriptional regulator [Lachnospiraceae bacterium]|nr:AraC family transcriptional regulator [Lachnospiraceae bacterium]
MKINRNIYPYNLEVKKLPFHLAGIGGTEYQYHIIRTEGYHWHQILFCAEGTGYVKYDNSTYSVNEGDFFFLPAGYPHEYYSDQKRWDIRWVAFDGYACAHVLSQFNMHKPAIISPRDIDVMENIYNKMFALQESEQTYRDQFCSGLIYEYVIEFYRNMDNPVQRLRNEKSKRLLPVLDYIDKHFYLDLPITALAEVAKVTPQHLCRIFKDSMNMRPNEYLTRRRLQESKRLLQKNELPIGEIAHKCGFPDAGYFSTVFRKHEGLSPIEYKKSIGLRSF